MAGGFFKPPASLANVCSLRDHKGGDQTELVLRVDLAVLRGDLESANVARALNQGLTFVSGEETGAGVNSGLARNVPQGAVLRGMGLCRL